MTHAADPKDDDFVLLNDLLDGRLDEPEAGAVRARIEAEPALGESWDELLQLRDCVRAYGPSGDALNPPASFARDLRLRIDAQTAARVEAGPPLPHGSPAAPGSAPRARRLLRMLAVAYAAAALVVVGFTVKWALRDEEPRDLATETAKEDTGTRGVLEDAPFDVGRRELREDREEMPAPGAADDGVAGEGVVRDQDEARANRKLASEPKSGSGAPPRPGGFGAPGGSVPRGLRTPSAPPPPSAAPAPSSPAQPASERAGRRADARTADGFGPPADKAEAEKVRRAAAALSGPRLKAGLASLRGSGKLDALRAAGDVILVFEAVSGRQPVQEIDAVLALLETEVGIAGGARARSRERVGKEAPRETEATPASGSGAGLTKALRVAPPQERFYRLTEAGLTIGGLVAESLPRPAAVSGKAADAEDDGGEEGGAHAAAATGAPAAVIERTLTPEALARLQVLMGRRAWAGVRPWAAGSPSAGAGGGAGRSSGGKKAGAAADAKAQGEADAPKRAKSKDRSAASPAPRWGAPDANERAVRVRILIIR